MRRALWTCLAGLFLCACSLVEDPERVLQEETIAFADEVQAALIARDAERLRALMGLEVSSQITDESLAAVLEYAPPAPQSQRTLNAFWTVLATTDSGVSRTELLTRELTAADGESTLVFMRIVTSDSVRSLLQLNVTPVTDEMRAADRLDLAGKSLLHYLVLTFFVAAPFFTIATLIAVILTKRLKRRVLWSVFVLFSFGSFSLNWATGVWTVNPLYFQLLGAAFQQVIYQGWILQFGLPVGAVLFWIMRSTGRLKLKETSAEGT